ncbi:retinoid-inducible serine carboxypeptidase-like [Dendronephthya gigantea]|uniref:retinoid-inducible serine carboxypeptidase-like n=1 Tax=Dendronephthya gigantea TaxID=151771 RepID=UPI00106AEDE7|nr:retinoid-inducible serine carboxypeptidase-like [Dendronephthya gigantea]
MFSTIIFVLFTLAVSHAQQIPDEKWSYVNVRENAFMFWWFYGAQTEDPATRMSKPLVLWIQGGPGASGTGFGNFEELGPEDTNGKKREYTWLKVANVLFVDNPVGSGFSYVTDDNAYTTNVTGIAADLLTMFKSFLEDLPVFKKIPFYIFCESYGGKMTSAFGVTLLEAVQQGEIQVDFRGVALGDSWISPVDTVLTWGPYLYTFSLLDKSDLSVVDGYAQKTANAFNSGQFAESTALWGDVEGAIARLTDNVNIYNVLQHNTKAPFKGYALKKLKDKRIFRAYWHNVGRLQEQSLSDFMNGPIRKKLGIIPDNVTWGAQSMDVFAKQTVDFMKPTIKEVSQLVNSGLMVAVYEGQLDIICDTIGAEIWINKIAWSGLKNFTQVAKIPLYAPSQKQAKNTGAFVKEYKNFHFYIILKAGHMVPADAPEMALSMVERILGTERMDKRAHPRSQHAKNPETRMNRA